MKIAVTRITATATACLFLLRRATADVSLTVNVDDLDPLKECNRRDVQLTVNNNKLYMYGGQSWVKNGTSTPIVGVNHYLRIADFTSPRDLNDSAILIAKDIPQDTTIFAYGAYWSDSDKLYIVGGSVVADPYLSREGDFIDIKIKDIEFHGGTVFNYDINADKWSRETATDNGDAVRDSFCCGAFAWNAQQRTAYYYSGSNWAGARTKDPNAVTYAIYRNSGDTTGNGNLLSFDTAAFKWSNQTTDENLTTTWTEDGRYVFLPGTESKSGGVGVILGGMRHDSKTIESLRKVLVYDSETGSWYSQVTTAENDQFPPNRVNYCAVAASAPDNSSHNIYMYGGEASGQTPNIAFSDMWILSIPSFHWIPVDVTSVPRKGLGCTVVAERYMATYGGLEAGWTVSTDGDKCDQENYGLRLFDLSDLAWQSRYNGPENSKYTVPSTVYKAIGGAEEGAATKTAPSAGFNTAGLASLFQKLSSPSSSSTRIPTPGPKKSNTGAIVGGIVGGLAVLAFIIIGAWLLLKRRKAKGTYAPAATSAPYEADGRAYPIELHGDGREGKPVYEMHGRQVELPPQELYADNTFSPPQNGYRQ